MQKKIISFIICIALIIGCFTPCFAISTDSAIKATKELNSNDLRANPPDGSSSNPYYINPQSSSGTRYYVNDSSGTVSSSSVYVTTWGDLMNHLSYTIAYSIKAVTTRLSNLVTNLSNYLNSTASSTYYYWDWSATNGVQQGAPESAETIVQAVRNIGSQLTKSLAYSTEYAYQTYQTLSNGLNISFSPYWDDLASYFEIDGVGGFIKTVRTGNVTSYTLPRYRQQSNGGSASDLTINFATSGGNVLGQLFYNFSNLNTSTVYAFRDLLSGVGAQNTTDGIYESDLTLTQFGRVSFWKDFRLFATNTSYFLSRLGFVLASDEEIAARQAAADNQDAFVDNFISSNGTGSASTTDLGDMASGSSAIKSALSSNADIDDALGIFDGDTSIWDWFTTETKNSFDNVSVERSSMDNYTHYVDNFYSEVLHGIHADIK